MDTLENRLNLIASRITIYEPFIAAVFTSVERFVVDTPDVTAATNGKSIKFGRAFCDKLTDEELLFVALHEAAHIVMMHMWRRNGRDPALWNLANDAIINNMLIRDRYVMPKGGVLIDWVDMNMSSEDVYNKLLQEQEQGQGGWGDSGDLEDAPDSADATDIEATIQTAARVAKACGDDNPLIARVLEGEFSPRLSWVEVLRHIMSSVQRNDYSYRKFNKRTASLGVYLPSLYNESLGGLLIAVDTSGSISEAQLAQISAEITAIAEDCCPDWVEVVYCDTAIQRVERFEAGESIKLEPVGGGGTRFAPVFEHALKHPERLAAVVYFTDLMGNTMECSDPGVPVVWGVLNNSEDATVPFGTVVRV